MSNGNRSRSCKPLVASLSLLLIRVCIPGHVSAADENLPSSTLIVMDEVVEDADEVVVEVPGTSPIPGQIIPGQTTPEQVPPGGAEKPESPAAQNSVKRPPADKYVPQPVDEEIRKNPDGKVAFNIRGQPWEPVLQWISDASALSLDWQELPGDSLNLITTRSYTMEEARDLINRHLLSRGFTMVVNGEVMSIVKVKDLNPALVQRVKPDQLASLPDHTICKVSFNLDWLIADEAVEELKPMLSSAGQIHKLSRTNRLEVVDTAVSLRHLWELIESEQSAEGEEQLVRAFRLEHRRAEDVIRMIRDLMKLQDPGGRDDGAGANPEMAMQMMQQVQQMQEQMQQVAAQAGAGTAGGQGKKVETRLVLNQRENMILAQAAPDQMAVIEKAIEQIDVESHGEHSLLQNINRMKVYRLESIDPQTLTDLLQQLGDLDPGTVLKVDKQKRSIIAWASLADHLTITTLVEKLDQSSRKIEVIPLRRLDAEYVAGTIRLLMGKEEEDKESNPFAMRYGYFDFDQMSQPAAKEPSFKVEADTENNRLLVNANAIEMDEIRDLLIKLGELPDPNATSDGMKVFDLNPDEDLERLREQLERYWQRGNRLEFDLPDRPKPEVEPSEPEATGKSKTGETKVDRTVDPTAGVNQPDKSSEPRVKLWSKRHAKKPASPGAELDQLLASHRASLTPESSSHELLLTGLMNDERSAPTTQSEIKAALDSNAEPDPPRTSMDKKSPEPRISQELIEKLRRQLGSDANARNPKDTLQTDERKPESFVTGDSSSVKISMAPDGKLIVSSSDPQALAAMEDLISQIVTPRRSFKVFRLKYATPSWVTLNLKDFFKAEEETKSTMEYSPYWGIMPAEKKVKGNRTLSKRRQPQFISDNFTSTILVRDADAKQLQTIEDLIAIYDVPEPSDTRSMRVTTIFRLENAKAASVAAAVKDVFRDLLSSNDKALETDDKGQQRQSSGGLVTFLPGAQNKDSGSEEEPIRFKGLLSIGIDESSNTLIVSSAGTLMDTIGEMIEALDEAADSSSVIQIINVDKSVDLGLIQERLQELMKSSQPVPNEQQGQPGQPVPGQPVIPGIQSGAEAAVDGN